MRTLDASARFYGYPLTKVFKCVDDTANKTEIPGLVFISDSFGDDRLSSYMTDVLQKVDVRIMSNIQCNGLYSEADKSIRVAREQLCAGHKEGKKDACTVHNLKFIKTIIYLHRK